MKFKNKMPYPELETFVDETKLSEDIPIDEEDKIKLPKARFGYSILCVIIIAALAAICVIAGNLNTAYTTVSISFSEITKGCNPDGSPLLFPHPVRWSHRQLRICNEPQNHPRNRYGNRFSPWQS